jgi:hypothetical protein
MKERQTIKSHDHRREKKGHEEGMKKRREDESNMMKETP